MPPISFPFKRKKRDTMTLEEYFSERRERFQQNLDHAYSLLDDVKKKSKAMNDKYPNPK